MSKQNNNGNNSKRNGNSSTNRTSGQRKQMNTKGKTKRNNFRSNRNQDCDNDSNVSRFDNGNNGNDPSWYAVSPQLLIDAGSYSFNNPLGVPMSQILGQSSAGDVPYNIPGIWSMPYILTPGPSADNASAVNVAARRLYTYVRHANSGSSNYDSPDLMLYVEAVREVANIFYHCIRAYGVANVYAQTNRYLPDGLLYAMGFSGDNLRSMLADYRYNLNVISAKMNSLAIPKTFKVFMRTTWLASSVFKDAETIKSQAYVFIPHSYKVYNEKSSSSGSYLQAKIIDYAAGRNSYTYWIDILNEMLSALIESEDIGIMAGDILKAYGQNGLYLFSGISEDFVVAPQYNPEVLMQIENQFNIYAIEAGFDLTSPLASDYNLKQDPNTGAILFKPLFHDANTNKSATDLAETVMHLRRLFNIRSNSPTAADVMVASRLTASGWTRYNVGNGEGFFSTYGTELIVGGIITTYDGKSFTSASVNSILMEDTNSDPISRMAKVSQFDWHPIVYTKKTKAATNLSNIFSDFSNVTSLGEDDLKKLNDTAVLSLYEVPSLTFG